MERHTDTAPTQFQDIGWPWIITRDENGSPESSSGEIKYSESLHSL